MIILAEIRDDLRDLTYINLISESRNSRQHKSCKRNTKVNLNYTRKALELHTGKYFWEVTVC